MRLQLGVAPTNGADAATKEYVDDEIAEVVSTGGGIAGPGTTVDNTVVRWSGTGGDTVQGSGVTISDTDDLDVPGDLSANNLSGTNTGDQDLSTLVPKTTTVNGHALSSNVTVTKGDVGLGNVDNTADTAKPVSTATQTALDGKRNVFMTGTVATAAATAAKTVTLNSPWNAITPAAGDIFLLAYTLGQTASSATVAINGGSAIAVRIANAAATNVSHTTAANGVMMYYYDGTYLHLIGSQRNSDLDTNTTYVDTPTTYNTVASTSQAAAVNTAYLANHASQVNFTLPTTAPVGSVVRIQGLGAGGWRATAASGDDIKFINGAGTATAGYITSVHFNDSVSLTCIVANTTWLVTNFTGRSVGIDGTVAYNPVLIDEDNFASDSDKHAPTQQSVKAYVDAATAAGIPGLTASAAELNILDGATLSTTELNYVDGVTSAIQTQLDGKVDENSAITGATKTKVTYDSKGLVTAGADATTADIADSSDKRYVTDAQLTVLGNTSGTNTGDQSTITGITGTKAEFSTAVTDGDIVFTDNTALTDTRTPTDGSVTTAKFNASALVTAAEGLASSDNDTSVPTTAAVIDAIAAGGGSGVATRPLSASYRPLQGVTSAITSAISGTPVYSDVMIGHASRAGKYRFVGTLGTPFAGDTNYLINNNANQMGVTANPVEVEFYSNATQIKTFALGSGKEDCWAIVDDMRITEGFLHANVADGNYMWTLTQSSAVMRKWRLSIPGGLFFAIGHNAGATMVESAPGAKIAVIGDSYVQGMVSTANAVSAGVAGVIAAGAPIGEFTQYTGLDVYRCALGGTGYVAQGSFGTAGPYGSSSRMTALATLPDMDAIIVTGSANDAGAASDATIVAAAESLWAAIKTARPDTPLIVMGIQHFNEPTASTAGYNSLNTALRAAALSNANVDMFIDERTHKWITGTGKDGSPAGDGNADVMISTDGIHLTHTGNRQRGLKWANLLATVAIPTLDGGSF